MNAEWLSLLGGTSGGTPPGLVGGAGGAHRLGISARTLQRRLHEEGTTFAKLVDEARHAMVVQMLAHRELAVGEVAFALGFSEPAAFHHAFKRWTGVTPAEFRRATSSPCG